MSAHDLALRDVLLALADELGGPRRSILAAERHLGAMLEAREAEAGRLRDLQGLDLAVQVLDDVGAALVALSRATSPDHRMPARTVLEALRLERLAGALRGVSGDPVRPVAPPPDLELF